MNQRRALVRSTQTAFFMRLISPSPSASSSMYICSAQVSQSIEWRVSSTYLAEHAKEGDPEDEKNKVPHRNKDASDAQDKGDEVKDTGYGRDTTDYYSVDLYIVTFVSTALYVHR